MTNSSEADYWLDATSTLDLISNDMFKIMYEGLLARRNNRRSKWRPIDGLVLSYAVTQAEVRGLTWIEGLWLQEAQ